MNEIRSNFKVVNAFPISGPPSTILKYLESKCYSTSFLKEAEQWGVTSEGFINTTFPAAIALIAGLIRVQAGKFQADITRTTPNGSWWTLLVAGMQ